MSLGCLFACLSLLQPSSQLPPSATGQGRCRDRGWIGVAFGSGMGYRACGWGWGPMLHVVVVVVIVCRIVKKMHVACLANRVGPRPGPLSSSSLAAAPSPGWPLAAK